MHLLLALRRNPEVVGLCGTRKHILRVYHRRVSALNIPECISPRTTIGEIPNIACVVDVRI